MRIQRLPNVARPPLGHLHGAMSPSEGGVHGISNVRLGALHVKFSQTNRWVFFWFVSSGWEKRGRWEAGRCAEEKVQRDFDRGQKSADVTSYKEDSVKDSTLPQLQKLVSPRSGPIKGSPGRRRVQNGSEHKVVTRM